MTTLHHAVTDDVIPRMLLRHPVAGNDLVVCDAELQARLGGDALVAEFGQRLLRSQSAAWELLVPRLALLPAAQVFNAVCDLVLTPVAQLLGRQWSADLCSFTDVTLAVGRLQGVLHEIDAATRMAPVAPRRAAPMRCVVLARLPTDQHTLGLAMVREQFRRGGWAVWHDTPVGGARLAEVVSAHHVDLVGLTIGNDRSLATLAEVIRLVRRVSRNPALRIMVGGPLVTARPQVATLVGADAAGTRASQAMLTAHQLTVVRDEST